MTQHLVVLNLRPRLRGLIQESLQKLSEFLDEHELLVFRYALDALFVDQFKFNPNQNRTLIEGHISL